jgi:hypothetical protein
MEKLPAVGSKAQVFHGKARHTSGGLTRKDLMKTKSGRIVSRKKHAAGKKAIKRLFKLGYKPKKGTFRLFSTSGKRRTRRSGGGVLDAFVDSAQGTLTSSESAKSTLQPDITSEVKGAFSEF